MIPQDPTPFAPTMSQDWLVPDDVWFQRLARSDAFRVAEKVHIARLALQHQWICDVLDATGMRATLRELGLHIAATSDEGYLIVSGNEAMAEYVEFRAEHLSDVEAGILYGYPPSAVVAFTSITKPEVSPRLPRTAAEYYLGGAYSSDLYEQERAAFVRQWEELRRFAPAVVDMAEREFSDELSRRAA